MWRRDCRVVQVPRDTLDTLLAQTRDMYLRERPKLAGERESRRSRKVLTGSPALGLLGKGRRSARSRPVWMVHETPMPGWMARPGALCMRSVLGAPGSGCGAGVGAPRTIPVTLSTHPGHELATWALATRRRPHPPSSQRTARRCPDGLPATARRSVAVDSRPAGAFSARSLGWRAAR